MYVIWYKVALLAYNEYLVDDLFLKIRFVYIIMNYLVL